MGHFTRDEIGARLQEQRREGRAIYAALCGSGITAKFAARGEPTWSQPSTWPTACRRAVTQLKRGLDGRLVVGREPVDER